MPADITVCIAHIPIREAKLVRAIDSVLDQILKPAQIVVEKDTHKTGAGATKTRAVKAATTEWVAILDDDDEFLPWHLRDLHAAAIETGADVVYADPLIPEREDQRDPNALPGPFDADELRRRSYIQTTALVRRELLLDVGGFQMAPGSQYDDWGAWLAMLDAGGSFYHHEDVTWIWHVDGENTSGLATRW